MRFRYTMILSAVLAFSVSAFGWDSKPKPWDELKGCRLLEHFGNDGDSFHVMHKGKEYIFRLCFVDCPETSDSVKHRVEEQAEWWGVTEDAVLRTGAAATAFSQELLKGGFTVFTRYEDARGRSALKRNFAMIRVGDGYLSEALVSAGLARVYGYPVVTPDGQAAKSFRSHLDELEKEAKGERKGAWATTGLKPSAADMGSGAGKLYKLTRQVALYSDAAAPQFMGNVPVGAVIFVPEQPVEPMVKLRAPLRGKVVSGKCRRRDLAGGVTSTEPE